ncbi:MAG TPA: nucleoside-diphosphate sugar epimerase/dehydratase, partial [Tepidisphaeraceae bacterium]
TQPPPEGEEQEGAAVQQNKQTISIRSTPRPLSTDNVSMGRLLPKLKLTLFPRRSRAVVAQMSPLDLLGRQPINLSTPELQRFVGGKRILVTGAGGSIGSEICRQVMKFCPQSLILLDRAENALFEIDQELRHRWIGADIRPYIADICDAPRIDRVLADEQPQVVFHAAAHKHVPMMERHPGEAVKNNVFGTKIIADAALAAGVDAFVMISTDKAVNPTSVMGATKRVAELYVQSLNEEAPNDDCRMTNEEDSSSFVTRSSSSGTCFCAVRFGNVLGSSGSVVPIFQKQIAAGGPLTVTHRDMRRYFMTIPEASQLVMLAGALGRGGDICVLDMGEPVNIYDLARDMIRRNGLVEGRDIELKITGMRPGEKLFEELANDTDQTTATSHPKIRVWKLPRYTRGQVGQMMSELHDIIEAPAEHVVRSLMSVVPEYQPASPKRAVTMTLSEAA